MTGLIAIAVILMGTWGVGSAFRLRFVHALPTTMMAIIFTLYLAYLVNLLHAAWWLVVALCVAGGIFGFVRHRRRDPSLRSLVPSAPLAAFLVAVVPVMALTRGRFVGNYDELRLWGAYPKLLFLDGSLQVGPDSHLMGEMQTYTPGLPLLGYFFEAFNSEFGDQRLFLAYGVLAIALVAPIAGRVSWQRPEWIVPAGVGMALLPLAYANFLSELGGYYTSLFSDPVVGLMLGHLVWLAATGSPRRKSWCWRVGLAGGVLLLIKASGLGLAAVVLVIGLGRLLVETRGQRLRCRVAGGAALVAPLGVVYSSWWAVQALLGPGSKFEAGQVGMHLDVNLLKEYVHVIVGRPEFSPGIGMFYQYTSFGVLNGTMVVAIGCLAWVRTGKERRAVVLALLGLLLCQVLFMIGIYVLVVGTFQGQFLSYPRYSATMLTAASTLLALLLTTGGTWRRGPTGTVAISCLSACIVLLALCFPLRWPVSYAGGWEADAYLDAQKLRAELARAEYPVDDPYVTLIYRDDIVNKMGHHHSVYYELLDTGARVDLLLPATLTPPDGTTYRQDVATARSEFKKYLITQDVRLILIAEENPELASQFGNWFDRPPHLDSLYEVVVSGRHVEFRWVS